MTIADVLNKLDGLLWGTPLIAFAMILGAYYMIRGKFFPFVHFGHILKNTILAKSGESTKADSDKISPYRAFCLAVGGAVGMGIASGKAAESIGRQPEAESKIRTMLMLGLVFIETAIIYALLVVILIIFVL